MYQTPFDGGLGAEMVEIAEEAVGTVEVGKELASAASWLEAAGAAVAVASCIAGGHNTLRDQAQLNPTGSHHVALTVAGSDLS